MPPRGLRPHHGRGHWRERIPCGEQWVSDPATRTLGQHAHTPVVMRSRLTQRDIGGVAPVLGQQEASHQREVGSTQHRARCRIGCGHRVGQTRATNRVHAHDEYHASRAARCRCSARPVHASPSSSPDVDVPPKDFFRLPFFGATVAARFGFPAFAVPRPPPCRGGRPAPADVFRLRPALPPFIGRRNSTTRPALHAGSTALPLPRDRA